MDAPASPKVAWEETQKPITLSAPDGSILAPSRRLSVAPVQNMGAMWNRLTYATALLLQLATAGPASAPAGSRARCVPPAAHTRTHSLPHLPTYPHAPPAPVFLAVRRTGSSRMKRPLSTRSKKSSSRRKQR